MTAKSIYNLRLNAPNISFIFKSPITITITTELKIYTSLSLYILVVRIFKANNKIINTHILYLLESN